MENERYETVDGQRYATWMDVQKVIIDDWKQTIHNMKNVANFEYHIPNWQSIKEDIADNWEFDVDEDFDHYNQEEWLNQIYVAIKPTIQGWLNRLVKEYGRLDYVDNFWNEN